MIRVIAHLQKIFNIGIFLGVATVSIRASPKSTFPNNNLCEVRYAERRYGILSLREIDKRLMKQEKGLLNIVRLTIIVEKWVFAID